MTLLKLVLEDRCRDSAPLCTLKRAPSQAWGEGGAARLEKCPQSAIEKAPCADTLKCAGNNCFLLSSAMRASSARAQRGVNAAE